MSNPMPEPMPERDALRLTIAFDEPWAAELFVSVSVDGFAGHGVAWFDPQKLRDLAMQLAEAFPLTETLVVQGGDFFQDVSDLEAVLVGLSFYPVAGRGVLGCRVRLRGDSRDFWERPQARPVLEVELLSSYQALQEFARDLMQLADGLCDEAVLHAAHP